MNNDQSIDIEFISLAGKTPQEATGYLRERGYIVDIRFTRDEKSRDEVEERVIRIKKMTYGLEVLVGFFQKPRYITGNTNGNPL